MTERLQVAVGILRDQQGRVLVGQRVVRDQYFAKWEFPGGKIEPGESVERALHREFIEEVGVEIYASTPLIELEHDYPDRKVRLYVRHIEDYQGEARGLESQALKWVELNELKTLDFLQGNQPIIELLSDQFF